ncbi:MAG: hypothetical protein ABJQ69_03755 [Ekhidna sp.]
MSTNSPKGGWKLKRDSHFKMIVWFKDGNVRTMYSLDWRHKYAPLDIKVGMGRLKKLIADYGSKANTAEIYELATGARIAKYFEGLDVGIDEQ